MPDAYAYSEGLRRFFDSLARSIGRQSVTIRFCYLAALFFLLALFGLASTVQLTDTDLWYHLTGGRAFFDLGTPANPFDRSFITPKESFINYFWGFQVIAWGAWNIGGYFGLIAVKTLLYLATAACLLGILLNGRSWRNATAFQLIVVALTVYLFSRRGLELRPHYFSYFFIAFFIYVLYYRERWAACLPFAALTWINVHGVEWVVGALICGAWTFGWWLEYRKEPGSVSVKSLVCVLLCLPVLLINPYGWNILAAPFLVPAEISNFAGGLDPFQLVFLLDFREGLTPYTAFFLLFLLAVYGLIVIFGRPRPRDLAIVLLAIGGALLLVRGDRFIWEWALLTTPLFARAADNVDRSEPDLWRVGILAVALGLVGHSWWSRVSPSIAQYPFDESSLPNGTTDFIERMDLKADYLLPPALAGYVEWRLYGLVRIHSDMQFPPFNGIHNFENLRARTSSRGLANMVDTYAPSLIGVHRENTSFARIVRSEPQYVPVFFDKKLVLYMDSNAHPDLASQYELTALNPFAPNDPSTGNVESALFELERMLAISPGHPDLVVMRAERLVAMRRWEEARSALTEIEAEFPRLQPMLILQARIAQQAEEYALAERYYQRARELPSQKQKIGLLLGEVRFHQQDYAGAYAAFDTVTNPWKDSRYSLLHYYLFAFSAFAIGETEEAALLLKVLKRIDDGRDPELTAKAEQLRRLVEQD